MATTRHYDAIVIGAGQSGGPLSTALARDGWKAAIIERVHVGGTRINDGCTPTKTMVASARVAYLARRGADYGVHTGPITVDLHKVWQRKQAIVEDWRGGSQSDMEHTENLELIFGQASFTGPKTVEVAVKGSGTRHLSADTILLNTGARPGSPKIPGLDQVPFLDSTSIMELQSVPDHLVALGGC